MTLSILTDKKNEKQVSSLIEDYRIAKVLRATDKKSPQKLSKLLEISIDEAQQILDGYVLIEYK